MIKEAGKEDLWRWGRSQKQRKWEKPDPPPRYQTAQALNVIFRRVLISGEFFSRFFFKSQKNCFSVWGGKKHLALLLTLRKFKLLGPPMKCLYSRREDSPACSPRKGVLQSRNAGDSPPSLWAGPHLPLGDPREGSPEKLSTLASRDCRDSHSGVQRTVRRVTLLAGEPSPSSTDTQSGWATAGFKLTPVPRGTEQCGLGPIFHFRWIFYLRT